MRMQVKEDQRYEENGQQKIYIYMRNILYSISVENMSYSYLVMVTLLAIKGFVLI
jgi:hypothetical protein